jgi:hypothetical protein
LARLRPAGFAPAFLAAIDAGLKLRAADRPQSIADWRAIFELLSAPDRPAEGLSPERRRGLGLWLGLAAAILALAGGGYYVATSQPSAPAVAAAPAVPAVPDEQRQQELAELARLRAESAAREKVDQEAALKHQVEEEVRSKIAAETAEKKRLEEETRHKAEEDARKAAEAAESALQLAMVDRQHIQVALVALGFGISPLDGTFSSGLRTMIGAWQKARKQPATGFLTGPQNQTLLQEAAAAVTRFDDEQKKIEEEKKKAAAGAAPVNPDIVPLEDNERIVLSLVSGQKCDATAAYIRRVFANRLDLQFRGGWQTFEANSAGDFGKAFTNVVAGSKLSVKGNLKTRVVSVENTASGCLWKGSF